MEITLSFAEIGWGSVLVATVTAFALGGVWYSPILFGKVWQKEIGMSDEESSSMGLIFGLSFVLNFISAVILDLFIGKEGGILNGFIMGLIVSTGWIATALGTNYLFSRKSLKLFMIDAFYFIVYFPIMGIILGAW